MSRPDDDVGEMPAEHLLDDATVEAVLNGDPVTPEYEAVASAVQSLRSLAEVPVRPTPELAKRIAAGDFTGAAAPLPSRRSTGASSPGRYRARPKVRPAWLGAMNGRARVATGLAVALTGLTGVTVAGALPGPAQDRVESVIEMITPIEFPSRADFGQETAEDARDGGVDGGEVSDRAKDQGQRSGSGNDRSEPGRDDLPERAQAPTNPPTDVPGGPERRPGPADVPRGPGARPTDPPHDAPGRSVDPPNRPVDPPRGAGNSNSRPGSGGPGPN